MKKTAAAETEEDMHALEVAFNPDAANDPTVTEVCGLRVPTKEEIWAAIKASPGAARDTAAAVLDGLPEMPSVDWPTVPDVDRTFWN